MGEPLPSLGKEAVFNVAAKDQRVQVKEKGSLIETKNCVCLFINAGGSNVGRNYANEVCMKHLLLLKILPLSIICEGLLLGTLMQLIEREDGQVEFTWWPG